MTPAPHSGSSRVPPLTQVRPLPSDANPLIGVWPADKDIVRVYDALYSPRGFWAGITRPGRFHPFTPTGAPGPVQVLYGSDRLAGAISETVFHDVPVRGTKHVPRATLRRKLAITLTAARDRDLRLADLTGYGLRRLGHPRRTHRLRPAQLPAHRRVGARPARPPRAPRRHPMGVPAIRHRARPDPVR